MPVLVRLALLVLIEGGEEASSRRRQSASANGAPQQAEAGRGATLWSHNSGSADWFQTTALYAHLSLSMSSASSLLPTVAQQALQETWGLGQAF